MKNAFLVIALLCLITTSSKSQISLSQFSTGLSIPVDIKNCGDNRLFVVEQRGTIQLLDTFGVKYARPFLNIQSRTLLSSEQGLLGMAFPPDYAATGYFYVNYTAQPNGETRISRFRNYTTSPDSADPNSEEILLRIYQPFTNHNGGHLAFGPDGYLYIGMGDGGNAGDPGNRAQNTDSLLGKMLRIIVDPANPTYSIPPTNPFASDISLGRPEIWTVGMRNPWRWSFDKITGDLWIGDVGQDSVEEVDFIPNGTTDYLNLGWRCWEGNRQYSTSPSCGPSSNYWPPVQTYRHPVGCSITGGYIYRGAKYNELFGKYFYSDYCVSNIHYLVPNGLGGFTDTNLGNLGAASIISFGTDKNDELYCSTGGGKVYKFSSANCTPVANIINATDTITDCGAGFVELAAVSGNQLSYNWYFNGTLFATDSTSIHASQDGDYVVEVSNGACSNSDTIHLSLVTPLNVTFTGLDTVYCIYNSLAFLFPNYLGGSFSGPGISLASFNPAVAGEGFHTITYTYTDGTGCTYIDAQAVHVDLCLGVPENNWLNTISVFPNPSEGDFNIHVYSKRDRQLNIELSDNLGQIILNEQYIIGAGESAVSIKKLLAKGVYFLKMAEGNNISVQKIIIQ